METIWLRVARQPGVGVNVDAPGQDQEAAGIDRFGLRMRGDQVLADRLDAATGDGHVGAERALGGDHHAAFDDQIGHWLPIIGR